MTRHDDLARFSPATRAWFAAAFVSPTPAQALAWAAIDGGEHSLIVAPTGSGKTLAAFLSALDALSSRPAAQPGVRVLYVSPLKALAVDVERNLSAPLVGIRQASLRLGLAEPQVRVGVRSGDTPEGERRRLIAHPPDILITTPESLFLILNSIGRSTLQGVETVIVDEVHALAGTKRGAHLEISLERLDELVRGSGARPPQRVGLSATVRPLDAVARFLGGLQPVKIVAPPAHKEWELSVRVPVDDLGSIQSSPSPGAHGRSQPRPSIWPHVEAELLDLVEASRSTIVFANSRRLAERITAHLNELHAERLGIEKPPAALGPPAVVMAQSGASAGPDGTSAPVIARAHHGSLSKERRAQIEADLKSGILPCVVATSSLELGIDMGAVDLVVQVGSPPSVASGLQRIGRAGHQVGAVSRGVILPTHRGDLVEAAVVTKRMLAGRIEAVPTLRSPLDVLAQQLVAMAIDPEASVTGSRSRQGADAERGERPVITSSRVFELVRRTASFAELPRSVFDGVLAMLTGRYPSEEFAELRPRLVWDRSSDRLAARPGALRLVSTSGGTIPDRGLFGVFLVGDQNAAGRHQPGRRVGELDEEMVYETRVGDVLTLGTTSWRVEEITHDQVLVSPAPGEPGRLPFWKGDSPRRPAELGAAIGAFLRELGAGRRGGRVDEALEEAGLDAQARSNLLAYLADQRAAYPDLPTDRTVVVERFRDELGDWRVCIHSALGRAVLEPWALLIQAQAQDRGGDQVSATAFNDGIVVRVPDTDADPPGVDLIAVDPERLEELVTAQLGGSALFAARFREAAARALLLPRRNPRARAPLWQQRMRSAQLLNVAAQYPDFPIVLEAVRECLTDVFDLPTLKRLHEDIAARRVRVVEVETAEASPFARNLLFGYLGQFVYEGDQPLAERRAAALALDPGLLAELLGSDALAALLDPAVAAAVEDDLQALSPERRAKTAEQLADIVRVGGPYTGAETRARSDTDLDADAAIDALVEQRRLARVHWAQSQWIVDAADLALLRDAIGVPVPPGYPTPEPEERPLDRLLIRWARTHGPSDPAVFAARYAIGAGVVGQAVADLAARGLLIRGRYFEDAPEQFCHPTVLAQIKRRTLAALRKEVEPVQQASFALFLTQWHELGELHGVDGTLSAVELLSGYPLPASMLETAILPARVTDYRPAYLDELLAEGEISWTGAGAIGAGDGWVRLWAGRPTPVVEPDRDEPTPLAAGILARLEAGGAWFFDDLVDADAASRADHLDAIWELVWAGRVTNDSLAALRSRTAGGVVRPQRVARVRRGGLVRARLRPPSPGAAGRWSAVRPAGAEAATQTLVDRLDRYGVLTRGSVLAEDPRGGYAPTYRALAEAEERGLCRRGYFVEGLGAAQFALSGAVDRLRAVEARQTAPDHDPTASRPLVLAATDPANAYGASLPWPSSPAHRPTRKAGALVVLSGGRLIGYVERGAKTLLTFDAAAVGDLARALADVTALGWLGRVTIRTVDAKPAFDHPIGEALVAAGFAMNPQGYRLRSSRSAQRTEESH